jgi:hypothetical protein
MFIALDYDDTYTRDPGLWNQFIELVKNAGHDISIVTKRGPSNQGPIPVEISCPIVYCDRAAKAYYCRDHNIHIDIWIDDAPQNLYQDG